jgi:hypothetical protein
MLISFKTLALDEFEHCRGRSSSGQGKLGSFQQGPVSTLPSPIATSDIRRAGGEEGTSPGVRYFGQREGRIPQKPPAVTLSEITSYVGHEITSTIPFPGVINIFFLHIIIYRYIIYTIYL